MVFLYEFEILWNWGWYFCFLALVGLGCNALLTHTLFLPIQEISKGISALKKRKSEYRINYRGKDEMGRLANAFNHLLETVGELDMAKVIQGTLLLQSAPEILGYETAFSCRMQSSLGGDYVDCFPIRSGQWGILLGDVLGHGVDSALTMAMAKSLIITAFPQ